MVASSIIHLSLLLAPSLNRLEREFDLHYHRLWSDQLSPFHLRSSPSGCSLALLMHRLLPLLPVRSVVTMLHRCLGSPPFLLFLFFNYSTTGQVSVLQTNGRIQAFSGEPEKSLPTCWSWNLMSCCGSNSRSASTKENRLNGLCYLLLLSV
jgi:hypothetical protein